ncbi:MAG: sugar ABC transporter ATP-binding protein [Methylobacteriaceae bacterium]|nr:sugar ABC transporter ATP-binding protein [Methylobacteriaceae bacterium]
MSMAEAREPVIEARSVSKYFGHVIALENVSLSVLAGEVVCLLDDNGAGKSTLIKILSGLERPDGGTIAVDGEPVSFASPRDAFARGIATVYQDLAVLPEMNIPRNFMLGMEPLKWVGPLRFFDEARAGAIARGELAKIGIEIDRLDQKVGTMSGGERQSLAIARAEYRGARVLILDEPTSALGVNEAAIVLRHVIRARANGRAVIFITHNVRHALPIGDRFVILSRGRVLGEYPRAALDETELSKLMGGGAEFDELQRELAELNENLKRAAEVS